MSEIREGHFTFKCPMDFNAMQPSANGVFCSKCSKEVFDLTDCTIDEVIALQKKHGRICGSIRVFPLAAAAVSLSAAACCPQVPQVSSHSAKDNNPDYYISGGDVCPPAELLKSK